MRNWKVSFEQLRLEPETSGMLEALQRGLTRFGIDYYLVGAISRNAWMTALHNINPRRATTDIDFAVFVNDKGVYEELKAYLIEQEDFASLPEIQLNEHRFKCCTLPGIVLLKLIAWDDRPEVRRDDIIDIADILHHFFDMHQEEIYANHLDLFERDELELIDMTAIVMGRELRTIASRDQRLFERIASILQTYTENLATSRIAIIMTEYFHNTAEDNYNLLVRLLEGYDTPSPPDV